MWHKGAALSLRLGAVSPAVPFSMLTLFLTFLKIGAVLHFLDHERTVLYEDPYNVR